MNETRIRKHLVLSDKSLLEHKIADVTIQTTKTVG